MRGAARTLTLAALLVPGLAGAPAHAGGGDGAAPAGVGPRLSVEPASFDFGRTRPHRVLRQQFRLRNLGDRELLIGDIRTDCGCTAALLAAGERALAPGASAALEVSLTTGSAAGPVVRRVLIPSNDPEHKAFELMLKVDVQSEKKGAR